MKKKEYTLKANENSNRVFETMSEETVRRIKSEAVCYQNYERNERKQPAYQQPDCKNMRNNKHPLS